MKGLIKFIGLTAGSWVGWWVGDHIGLMTAVVLSSIGAGLGLYLVIIIDKKYLG